MSKLGSLYEKMHDYTEAAKWYRKAADAGNELAMESLGSLYEKMHDYTKAAKWYREAVDEGNKWAMRGAQVSEITSRG